MRLVAALAVLLVTAPVAAPVAAMSYGTDSFYDAKSGYRVTVSHDADAMLLDGYNATTHARLHLKVLNGVVTGEYGGKRVNYILSPAAQRGDALASATE